jgi:hypothetical protein
VICVASTRPGPVPRCGWLPPRSRGRAGLAGGGFNPPAPACAGARGGLCGLGTPGLGLQRGGPSFPGSRGRAGPVGDGFGPLAPAFAGAHGGSCVLGALGPGLHLGGLCSPASEGGRASGFCRRRCAAARAAYLASARLGPGLHCSAPFSRAGGGNVRPLGACLRSCPWVPVWPRQVSAAPHITAGSASPFLRAGMSYRRRPQPLGTCLCRCPGGLFGLSAPRPRPRSSSRRALLLRSRRRASLIGGGYGPSAPACASARVVYLASTRLGLSPHRGGPCSSVLAGGPV